MCIYHAYMCKCTMYTCVCMYMCVYIHKCVCICIYNIFFVIPSSQYYVRKIHSTESCSYNVCIFTALEHCML